MCNILYCLKSTQIMMKSDCQHITRKIPYFISLLENEINEPLHMYHIRSIQSIFIYLRDPFYMSLHLYHSCKLSILTSFSSPSSGTTIGSHHFKNRFLFDQGWPTNVPTIVPSQALVFPFLFWTYSPIHNGSKVSCKRDTTELPFPFSNRSLHR